nr:hypothetical protein [Tanacetum cinerariifolium]
MAIPSVMLNDDIKDSAEYSEYLAKSNGSKPVPNKPSDSFSSSSYDSEEAVKEISSDEADDTEKANDVKKAYIKKDIKEQVAKEHVANEQAEEEEHGNDQGGNEQDGDAQVDVHISKPHIEKLEATLISSSQTLSSVEFTNQFLNETAKVTLTNILKDLVEYEVQSMVDILVQQVKPAEQRPPLSKKLESQVDICELDSRVSRLEKTINAMSRFNLPGAIDKSVKAHLKNILRKDVPDFGKIKLKKAAKKSMSKYSTTPFDHATLDKFYQKDNTDEDDMNRVIDEPPSQKKRHQDNQDHDPYLDPSKEKKKRNQKDYESSSKDKYQGGSSKKEIEIRSSVKDDVVDAENLSQADASVHARDNSTWFKKDKITKADLEGPLFKLMKGKHRNYIDLEYNFEQCYLALTDELDWVNLKDFFLNKDLEYLSFEDVEKRYATSLTKPKAARYDLEGIEQMIPTLWSSSKFGYGYLKEIVLRHANQQEYTFKEADFLKLHLNDIEHMYLLIVNKSRVEDVQLGVESYQTKLNITCPYVRSDGLDAKEPYTIFHKPIGVVHLNKDTKKYLMRANEVYKFGDGTLKKVRNELDFMLKNFKLGYNKWMPTRAWSDKDKRRTTYMLEKIGETLLTRRIMRSLKCYVSGKSIKTDYKLLDAKTLFEAIQARFGGNDATKKTQTTLLKQMYENFNAPSIESLASIFNRLQKIISQLAILGENISQEDLNMKFLRSLPSKWPHVVVWRNKADLDIKSIDDLYNNFKIVKQEVKRMVTSSSSLESQNMAFLSSPGSTNEDDTASIQVSTISTPVNTVSSHDNTANLSDATVYAFMANQPNGSQLVHEDLEQIHKDNLEEIDLKWQLALLSMRARRYFQRTGKKITINGSNTAGYDKTMIECFNCHKMGHFTRECKSPRNQESRPKNQDSSKKTMNVEDTYSKAIVAVTEAGLGFTSYNVVAPPPTGLFAPPTIDLSNSCLKEFQHLEFKGYGPKDSKSVYVDTLNEIKKVPNALIIKDWVSDSDEDESEEMVLKSDNFQHKPEQANQPRKVSQNPRKNRTNWNEISTQKLRVGFHFTKKVCFVCGSFSHLIKDCDFHDKKIVQKPALKNMENSEGS